MGAQCTYTTYSEGVHLKVKKKYKRLKKKNKMNYIKLAKTTHRFWLGYNDIFDKNKNKKVWGR